MTSFSTGRIGTSTGFAWWAKVEIAFISSRMTINEWADRYRIIPPEFAQTGLWTTRLAHMRAVMQA